MPLNCPFACSRIKQSFFELELNKTIELTRFHFLCRLVRTALLRHAEELVEIGDHSMAQPTEIEQKGNHVFDEEPWRHGQASVFREGDIYTDSHEEGNLKSIARTEAEVIVPVREVRLEQMIYAAKLCSKERKLIHPGRSSRTNQVGSGQSFDSL